MVAKSHLDLCMFVQILEVDDDQIPSFLREPLLSRDVKPISKVIEDHNINHYSFVRKSAALHESIHLCQAVIYPFIRWQAMLTFYQIMDIFAGQQMEDALSLQQADPAFQFTIPSLFTLDMPFRVLDLRKRFLGWTYRHEMGVQPARAASLEDKRLLVELTANDLFENAASLIQYKFSEENDFPTWADFSRWAKRNPAYTNLIEFAGKFLGDWDLAVRIFCALAQVSFETNQPVRAFAILLSAFKFNYDKGYLSQIVSQPEPCRWIEVFGSCPAEWCRSGG